MGTKQRRQRLENQADHNLQDVSEYINDIGEKVQLGLSRANRTVRSRLKKLDVDETTIPDAFQDVPKFISPRVHSWLDLAVTGYFIGLGIWCAARGKSGASTAAFVNAGMVAGVSLLTDYEGTGKKPLNFKLHGTMDALQATTAALGPVLHGFTDEPEAVLFYGQAANELAVIASTDWDAGMPRKRAKKAA